MSATDPTDGSPHQGPGGSDDTGAGPTNADATPGRPGDSGPQGAWGAAGADPRAFGGQAPHGWPGAAHHGGGGHYGPPPPPPGAEHGAPQPAPGDGGGPTGRRKVLGIAAVTALVTSLIVGPAAAVVTTQLTGGGGGSPISSLTNGQASSVSTGSVSEVAEKTLPSVVSIKAGQGTGSGVIISSDGQILTNNHVVAEASGDTVAVQFNDGSEAEAEILGADPVSDLAVIKAKGKKGLTPAVFGDSDKVKVGADVVAIGSPLGLSGTVTSGVVSATDRPVNTGVVRPEEERQQQDSPFGLAPPEGGEGPDTARTSTVINAIQTDAPINPGNSGGPLMNMNGEVIGINTAIAGTGGQGGQQSGSIGLGFAIPINQAKPIAEQLIKDGRASYAAIDATISEPRDREGAVIVETSDGGAAAEAGLKRGDVVTKVGDREISGADELIAAIRSHQPGDKVTIGYERDGNAEKTEITLSAQSADSIGS